jgi:hypothetical protein
MDIDMEGSRHIAPMIDPHESPPIPKSLPSSAMVTDVFELTNPTQVPVHKTIETTELLERILYYVPTLDLCCARRVSKEFRNTIDNSLSLQKNLFLKASAYALQGSLEYEDNDEQITENHEFHPLIAASIREYHPLITASIRENPMSDFWTSLYLWNPRNDTELEASPIFAICSLNQLTQTFENAGGVSEDSLLYNMYLTNPPVKKVEISVTVPYWNLYSHRISTHLVSPSDSNYSGQNVLTDDQGVTFGQVFEYTKLAVKGEEKMVLPDPLPAPRKPRLWEEALGRREVWYG